MRSVRAWRISGVIAARPALMPESWCCGTKYSRAAKSAVLAQSATLTSMPVTDVTVTSRRRRDDTLIPILELPIEDIVLNSGPDAGARVDQVEVAGALQRNQLRVAGSLGEALAHFEWDQVVGCAVQHTLLYRDGQQFDGRSRGVALWNLVR